MLEGLSKGPGERGRENHTMDYLQKPVTNLNVLGGFDQHGISNR